MFRGRCMQQLDLFPRAPPPDFSGTMQFDPEKRTAEAAAARKRVAPCPPASSFIADLNGYRVTQDMLRHPSGPLVSELVKTGTIVKTSYDTGPYVVKQIVDALDYGVQTYSLLCGSPTRSGNFILNELVAVDGRILKLFLACEDEVFILDDIPTPEGQLL